MEEKKKKIQPKKIAEVENITKKLQASKTVFLTDYRGLTHPQLETLRRSLKKVQAEYVIAKNTLLKIAFGGWNQEVQKSMEPELKNPTAALIATGDEIAAIKTLADFIKTTQLPKIKIGFFAGKSATAADFQKLASLPTREVLLATLAARLKSPIAGLHYSLNWNLQKFVTVLNNVKSKKPIS